MREWLCCAIFILVLSATLIFTLAAYGRVCDYEYLKLCNPELATRNLSYAEITALEIFQWFGGLILGLSLLSLCLGGKSSSSPDQTVQARSVVEPTTIAMV